MTVDKPFIVEGRTLVPMRSFFEAMGAKVEWDAQNYTASGSRNGKVVSIPIGSTKPTINGVSTSIDVPAQIINGRTYIPLRFVGEALGDKVSWDGKSRSIYITRSNDDDTVIQTKPGTAQIQDIIFLHHSTGGVIWKGGVREWFDNYNKANGKKLKITETEFPKASPYGWNNYPYDYYNIWVKNAGDQPFMEEPTLEILTKQYDVIIFKHCFPVSRINADGNNADVNSYDKTLGNYKLQYEALKKRLNAYPQTKFIAWTPTALVEKATNKEQAQRADEFSKWVKTVWDTPNDNIYLWDFRSLQTEGGLYFKNVYAESETNSHPNVGFAKRVAPNFCQRIVDVVDGNGDKASVTGK